GYASNVYNDVRKEMPLTGQWLSHMDVDIDTAKLFKHSNPVWHVCGNNSKFNVKWFPEVEGHHERVCH
ncbi:MAG: hypothetical protein QXH93_04890, partial [Conexivisphaerales archaeon]